VNGFVELVSESDAQGIYLPLKFLAYLGVVLLGARIFKFAPDESIAWCLLVAAGRMLIGLALGIPIYIASTVLQQVIPQFDGQLVLVYVLVYVPARWVAWSLTAPMLNPLVRGFGALVSGVGRRDLQWRWLGVAVSCSLDVIMIAAFGQFPVGKFFC